jgi:hypothetical protein
MLLIFSTVGCHEPERQWKTPADVMSRDSMVQVMATVHITEARIMQANNQQLKQEEKSRFVLQSLSNHQIDTALFNRSFSWYASHPDLFSEMYDDILSEISRRQVGISDK